jgi:hypothetical protein
LLLEIGHDQAQAVCALAHESMPGTSTTVATDLSGLDRVVTITPGC